MRYPRLLTLLWVAGLLLCSGTLRAGDAGARKQYEGTWYNRDTRRYLAFFFEDGSNVVTVNDWTGTGVRGAQVDAYKAFLQDDGSLLIPEDTEHHAPSCTLKLQGNKLAYICLETLNGPHPRFTETLFTRKRR